MKAITAKKTRKDRWGDTVTYAYKYYQFALDADSPEGKFAANESVKKKLTPKEYLTLIISERMKGAGK